MRHSILPTLTAAVSLAISATSSLAHPDRGEKRPQTYAEVSIPWTRDELNRETYFRHPPGNVRAEDIAPLFAGKVMLVDRGGKYSSVPGVVNHALDITFHGRDGRLFWCSYGSTSDYYLRESTWAPARWKHGKTRYPLLDPATDNNRPGLSPIYNGETGQIVTFRHRQRTWHTWEVGHLQERLPRAVYTLCPDFPSPEELGVEVNEAQTAITYDTLIQQDPGRRILRPDLITLDPTEPVQ